MFLLIVGLILWMDGHLWGRIVPSLYTKLGKAAYAVSAVVILVSVALMVIGYRAADVVPLWATMPWMIYVNNIFMVFALYTYFATATPRGTVWLVGNLKHPQLTGFKIWAVAHLFVNGDLASVILFGGLLAWAVFEVILINKQGDNFDRSKTPLKTRFAHLVLVVAALVGISGIHIVLGVNPFGG